MSERYVPIQTPETEPLWAAARDGKLLLQRCLSCDRVQYWRRILCSVCGSTELHDTHARGTGSIYSFTVVWQAPNAALAGEVPYILALVDLAEGCRLMTQIVDIAPDDVSVGQEVKLQFKALSAEISLPVFAPVSGSVT